MEAHDVSGLSLGRIRVYERLSTREAQFFCLNTPLLHALIPEVLIPDKPYAPVSLILLPQPWLIR
jgi:hypothetical protein